jgi:hypothetical protein
MRNVTITLQSDLSVEEIHLLLEAMFWDGSVFEDFENVDWKIQK